MLLKQPRNTNPNRLSLFSLCLIVLGSLALVFTGSARAEPNQTLLQITPGGGLEASTFSNGSFKIENNSVDGQNIESVNIDLSTALLPDMVFDPNGTAGDEVAKCFTADSGAEATGLTTPNGACGSPPFAQPHDGQAADGYDALKIGFNDFGPGETFAFSTDVDPTSIKGDPDAGGAGSVSGLELTGATVTVVYSGDAGGTTAQTYRIPASNGGSQAVAKAGNIAKPAISANGSAQAQTVSNPNQNVKVEGPAGSEVSLLVVESGLFVKQGGGYDIDPYEANKALKVTEKTATVGQDGTVNVPVALTKSDPKAGLNYIVAVVEGEGRTGPNSNVLVLKLGDSAQPEPDNVVHRVNAGGGELGGTPPWGADTKANPSPFVNAQETGNTTFATTDAIDTSEVPAYVPMKLFQSERYDEAPAPEMQWNFPVEPGQYEVRLYFAEIFDGAASDDARLFDVDVEVEGNTVLDDYDVFENAGNEVNKAVMEPISVTVKDNNLDINFLHVKENPAVKGIEVLAKDGATTPPPEPPEPPKPPEQPEDTAAPNTKITGGPKGFVRSRTASFAFKSSENGSTFECRLDRRAFAPCSSPKVYRKLSDGRHAFWVRATDSAGNTDKSAARRVWRIDTHGPAINRVSPRGRTADRTPVVRATVRDAQINLAKRNIKVYFDGKRKSRFSYSPRTDRLTYKPGRVAKKVHKVRVVAIDRMGNRTVRVWRFRVV